MPRTLCLGIIMLTIFLCRLGVGGGAPLAEPDAEPDPEALLNSLLSLLDTTSLVSNGTSALGSLALGALPLTHLDHQLDALDSLGDLLATGLNITDSFLG